MPFETISTKVQRSGSVAQDGVALEKPQRIGDDQSLPRTHNYTRVELILREPRSARAKPWRKAPLSPQVLHSAVHTKVGARWLRAR